MADEKTALKAEFYKWLDLSENERSLSNMPLTDKGFSEANGVSTNTLRKWRESRNGGGGEFNLQAALSANKEKLFKALMVSINQQGKTGKSNSQILRLFTQLTGDLIEKKEETVKLEYSSDEIARDSEKFIQFLADELKENGGACPICSKSYTLLAEVCDNQEY